MRILLIHQYFLEKDDGGGSRFNEFTRHWAQEGHKITVIAGMVHYNTGKKRDKYKGKFTVKERYSENIDVLRCHVSESYNSSFLGRLWGYFSFVFSSIFAGVFKINNKYDIIISTSPPLFIGITAYMLSKLKGIPFLFEIRDLWPESAIDTGVLTNKPLIKLSYWFESFIYKKASLINVLTPAFREKLITNKGVRQSKIIYIPNAADFSLSDRYLETFDRKKFRENLDIDDCLAVIYVGAHGVANALSQILDTASILKGEKVVFLLVGAGMQKIQLIEEARRRGLTNVKFIDPVPKSEIFKYILASDIGSSVLKRVDTFKTVYSNKTFDYMSCKKPVLMAIDGVSRKLVEDAECGYYVEPENPEEFARKITCYIENPSLLKIHGESGYKYAKKHFDREFLAGKYLSELKKINNDVQ